MRQGGGKARRLCLAKEWNSVLISRKRLHYLYVKDFSNTNVNYLKKPLTPLQHKIIVSYQTSNYRLTAIETGWWSTIPIYRDKGYDIFALDIVENEVHFVLVCPLYNSMRDKFQSLMWECYVTDLGMSKSLSK